MTVYSVPKKSVSVSGHSYPAIRIKDLDPGSGPILDLEIIVKSSYCLKKFFRHLIIKVFPITY